MQDANYYGSEVGGLRFQAVTLITAERSPYVLRKARMSATANLRGTMRKIALEEHFTTPELAKKYVARPTQSDKLFADVERRLADFDELRLETMDKAGIDVMVLSVTTPGVQGEPDAGTAVRLARNANDFLAREVQRRPDRYAGFAHLAMQDAAAAAAGFHGDEIRSRSSELEHL